METQELREKQLETLEELYNYDKKLIPAVIEFIEELKGEPREDATEYLNLLIEGINWNIEVINLTMDILNENEQVIDKDDFQSVVLDLNEAISQKDSLEIAAILEMAVIPTLQEVSGTIPSIIDIKEN